MRINIGELLAKCLILLAICSTLFIFGHLLWTAYVPAPNTSPHVAHVVMWTINPVEYDTFGGPEIHKTLYNASESKMEALDLFRCMPMKVHVIENMSMRRIGTNITHRVYKLNVKPRTHEGNATSYQMYDTLEDAAAAKYELHNAGLIITKMEIVEVTEFPYTVYCSQCRKSMIFSRVITPKDAERARGLLR